LKLYYAPMTRSGRVRWLLEELGVPYDLERVDLYGGQGESPEYRKIHPLGAVPALEDDGLVLHESGAICMYLADRFPEKRLAPPAGTADRARYYQWLCYAMTTLEPEVLEIFAQTVSLPEEARSKGALDAALGNFKEAVDVLEAELAGKEWLVGGAITAADVVMISILAWAKQLKVLSGWPVVEAYVKRGSGRPQNKKARAD